MGLAWAVQQTDEVLVVSAVEDLGLLTQFGGDREQGIHPLVIEGHEEVVAKYPETTKFGSRLSCR